MASLTVGKTHCMGTAHNVIHSRQHGQIKEMMKAFYHANHDMEIPNNDPTQGKMNKQQFTNGIFTTLEAHGLGDEGPQFLQGMKLLETQIYNATERYKEESIC